MRVNEVRHRNCARDILIEDLIDHYIHTELSEDVAYHSLATRIVYRTYLNKWIRPYWAETSIYSIRTIDVERWLRSLRRIDGELLAD
jgi:hypothetical protein